jgi:hypothetical protein
MDRKLRFAMVLVFVALAGSLSLANDPIPLRRVLLPLERLPQEMERVRQGVLIQLSQEEFEARVARAARLAEAARNPPQLVETRYQAALRDASLVGTGQWTVQHAASEAGVLPVQPFNLAVRQARVNNAGALFGEVDARGLGLLVDRPGQHALTLDWTARGDAGPDGIHFELQIPACPLTTFDLDTPADRVVTLSRDVGLLTGPHPAETPDRRRWRIDCSGRSKLDLVVLRTSGTGRPPPLILARVQSRQDLAVDLVEAELNGSSKSCTRACGS